MAISLNKHTPGAGEQESARLNDVNQNWGTIEQAINDLQANASLRDVTISSDSRTWHNLPSGDYYVGSDGIALGYPSDYMTIIHVAKGSIVMQFAFGRQCIASRRFNQSQSMDWYVP